MRRKHVVLGRRESPGVHQATVVDENGHADGGYYAVEKAALREEGVEGLGMTLEPCDAATSTLGRQVAHLVEPGKRSFSSGGGCEAFARGWEETFGKKDAPN